MNLVHYIMFSALKKFLFVCTSNPQLKKVVKLSTTELSLVRFLSSS